MTLEEKYIDLLLKRCIGVSDLGSLLINLDLKEHLPFATRLKQRAFELGVSDVEIVVFDAYELHDVLKEISIDDINLQNSKMGPLIDRSIWNEYAKNHGGIIFIDSEVPGLMNDVDPEKIQKMRAEISKTNEYYRNNLSNGSFTWTIAALPNLKWASIVFPGDDDSYEKLYLKIMEACMVDMDDPRKSWDDYFSKMRVIVDNLNSLEISKLRYQNSLGTNLYIGMPKGHIWMCSDEKNSKGNSIMSNMPSYEVFSSPDYSLTNGIVYASKPLVFQGVTIENFYFRFENGKVIDFGAEKGGEALEKLFDVTGLDVPKEFNRPDYLGEVAFVEHDSPISNTGIVYYNTLFDENASCHLALGDSFEDALEGGVDMSKRELLERGLNQAVAHVDFMIGTSDLNVVASTKIGEVFIIENGNFSKMLCEEIIR